MVWAAVQDFAKQSEMRIVRNDLRIRVLPDAAQNYDAGMYREAVDMWQNLIKEIGTVDLVYPNGAHPVFYVYFVPDDFYNNTDFANMVGKAEYSVDKDGFIRALCYLQKTLTDKTQNDKVNVFNRVAKLHELSHCMHSNFGEQTRLFCEGFAEIIPWYILGYERRIPTHLKWMRALPKIYSIQDYRDNRVSYNEKLGPKICSYQSGYVSAYLLVRAIISNVEKKLKISPCVALQKFLDLWHNTGYVNSASFAEQCANLAGMDARQLIYTTEYQNQVLVDIERELAAARQIDKGQAR